MKPLTAEWIAKAEADFHTMERESRVRRAPNHDGVCFHAQQRAEKYLKARLCEAELPVPKAHDLVLLLKLALPEEPMWEACRPDLAFLSSFSVAARYPGHSLTREIALDARKRCRAFRKTARRAFGVE